MLAEDFQRNLLSKASFVVLAEFSESVPAVKISADLGDTLHIVTKDYEN